MLIELVKHEKNKLTEHLRLGVYVLAFNTKVPYEVLSFLNNYLVTYSPECFKVVDSKFPADWVLTEEGYMPRFIAEGGVYCYEKLANGDQELVKLLKQEEEKLIKLHYPKLLQNKKDLAKSKYEADVKEAKEHGWELPQEPDYDNMVYP